MLFTLVGLTAIDVSLCAPTDVVSQSVFAFGVNCGAVVQIAVPVFTAGPVPNTALGTGAGALIALCVKSTGCGSLSPNAATLATSAAPTTTIATAPARIFLLPMLSPFLSARPASASDGRRRRYARVASFRRAKRRPRGLARLLPMLRSASSLQGLATALGSEKYRDFRGLTRRS